MDIFKKDIHLLFIQLQIGYGIPYIYLINFTSYKKTRYITQFKKTIDEEKKHSIWIDNVSGARFYKYKFECELRNFFISYCSDLFK